MYAPTCPSSLCGGSQDAHCAGTGGSAHRRAGAVLQVGRTEDVSRHVDSQPLSWHPAHRDYYSGPIYHPHHIIRLVLGPKRLAPAGSAAGRLFFAWKICLGPTRLRGAPLRIHINFHILGGVSSRALVLSWRAFSILFPELRGFQCAECSVRFQSQRLTVSSCPLLRVWQGHLSPHSSDCGGALPLSLVPHDGVLPPQDVPARFRPGHDHLHATTRTTAAGPCRKAFRRTSGTLGTLGRLLEMGGRTLTTVCVVFTPACLTCALLVLCS